jgi:hypothetical protein
VSIWLAVLQGATEILPVSSLGHGVILPTLLGWDVNQNSPTYLPFFVVLHLVPRLPHECPERGHHFAPRANHASTGPSSKGGDVVLAQEVLPCGKAIMQIPHQSQSRL